VVDHQWPDAGEDLDALVAERVFGATVRIFVDGVFGRGAYAVDATAVRTERGTTTARLLGADWIRAKTEDGEVVEFFGRGVPGYSRFVVPMWELVQAFDSYELKWNSYSCCHTATLTHFAPEAFGDGRGPSAAVALCYAALDAVQHSPESFPIGVRSLLDAPPSSARCAALLPTYGA
jgi:hypothetical protein